MIKLLKQNWPRLLLYSFMILLVVCSICFLVASHQTSLSENLLTGSIEIVITVILIDGLLLLERGRKIKALNKSHADATRYLLAAIIMKFMSEFGFKVIPNELEIAGSSNTILKSEVDRFFSSKEYSQYLKDVRSGRRGIAPKLKKLRKLVEDSNKSVRKSLEGSQPYPDPKLIESIDTVVPGIVAFTEVMKVMYESMKIARKGTGRDGAIAKEILSDEIERLTTIHYNEDNDINMHKLCRAFISALLMIHDRAEKNDLHYDF